MKLRPFTRGNLKAFSKPVESTPAPPVAAAPPTIVAPVVVGPLPIARTNNGSLPVDVRTSPRTTRKRSQITTITVAASASFTMAAYGNRFMVLSSPCPVKIRYDSTSGFSTYAAGLGIMIDTVSDFDFLEFHNDLTVAISVMISFGWDELSAAIPPAFPATPTEGWVLMTGAVVQLVNTPTYFRYGFFYGYQAAPGAGAVAFNANVVYAGRTQNMPDQVPVPNPPGALWLEYAAPAGQLYNLQNFNFLGTAPDGIFYTIS